MRLVHLGIICLGLLGCSPPINESDFTCCRVNGQGGVSCVQPLPDGACPQGFS